MFIQGDLQAVFDVLYNLGEIDPVLKMDWTQASKQMTKDPNQWQQVIELVNSCSGNRDLLTQKLKQMDSQSVLFIAMEVAREFAEFSDRQTLH